MSRYVSVYAGFEPMDRQFRGCPLPGWPKFPAMTDEQKVVLLDRVDLFLTETFMRLSASGTSPDYIAQEIKTPSLIGIDSAVIHLAAGPYSNTHDWGVDKGGLGPSFYVSGRVKGCL